MYEISNRTSSVNPQGDACSEESRGQKKSATDLKNKHWCLNILTAADDVSKRKSSLSKQGYSISAPKLSVRFTIAEHTLTPWQMLSQPSGFCRTASSKPLKTKAPAFSQTYGSLTHNKRIRFNPLTGRQKAKYCIELPYESTGRTKVTFGSY